MRFTDRGVKALKPRDPRYEVFEDGRKGLGLRISPRGGKFWVFVYRRNGKLSCITVGVYPDTSVADAHAHLVKLRAVLSRAPSGACRTNGETRGDRRPHRDSACPPLYREVRQGVQALLAGGRTASKRMRSRAGGTSRPRTLRAETWWPSSMISSTADR